MSWKNNKKILKDFIKKGGEQDERNKCNEHKVGIRRL